MLIIRGCLEFYVIFVTFKMKKWRNKLMLFMDIFHHSPWMIIIAGSDAWFCWPGHIIVLVGSKVWRAMPVCAWLPCFFASSPVDFVWRSCRCDAVDFYFADTQVCRLSHVKVHVLPNGALVTLQRKNAGRRRCARILVTISVANMVKVPSRGCWWFLISGCYLNIGKALSWKQHLNQFELSIWKKIWSMWYFVQ